MIIGIFDWANTYIDENKNDYGGSQTWLIEIVKQFDKLGHTVYIFCNTKFHKNNNLFFIHKDKFLECSKYIDFDKFIYCRGIKNFNCVNSKEISLILHDENYGDDGTGNLEKIKNIYLLSNYSKTLFSKIYGNKYENKYKLTFNGINQNLYHPETKKENMMVWSSCLYRGFEFFITKVYPKIKKEVPDFILNVCSYNKINFKSSNGIKVLGRLNKLELSNLQNKAKLWCYPNLGYGVFGSTKKPFNETFCITALENASAGANIVCGANGGLLTTLPEEILLGKEYFKNNVITDEEKYANLLAEKCIDILKDRIEIKCDVSKYTWENAAKSLL